LIELDHVLVIPEKGKPCQKDNWRFLGRLSLSEVKPNNSGIYSLCLGSSASLMPRQEVVAEDRDEMARPEGGEPPGDLDVVLSLR